MTSKEIFDVAYKKIQQIYGELPDLHIANRFYSEKKAFEGLGVARHFEELANLRRDADLSEKKLVFKSPIVSSFIAYLLGITDENPLPAHYYCKKCKCVEFIDNACVLDMRPRTCSCGEQMRADGFDIPFETYIPYAKKLKLEDTVPETHDGIPNLCRVHLQPLLIDDVCLCKKLERTTGIRMEDIDLNDSGVKHSILSGKATRIAGDKNNITNQYIFKYLPQSYSELLTLIGLLHGTNTWSNNAHELLDTNICYLSDIPATRDDVFMTIQNAIHDSNFYGSGFAFEVSENTRRGRYAEQGMDSYTYGTLIMLGFEDWFVSYILRVGYMTTKALCVLTLKYTIILEYYRIYYPEEYEKIIVGG